MKRSGFLTLFAFLVGLVAGGALLWLYVRSDASSTGSAGAAPTAAGTASDQAQTTRYHCAMHPGYVSDKPGDCPICGMRLVPIEEAAAPVAEPVRKTLYRSTMNPNEVSDRPGKDSMGMDMVPVEVETEPASPIAGYATINVPIARQQSIGVTTQPVRRRQLASVIHAVGRVDYDETRLSWVNTKLGGWIETLFVDRMGQLVRKGQPLLEIYSPGLVSTQQEYLIAKDNLAQLETSGAIPTAVGQARGLLEDTRRRLELWDIPDDQIRALGERGALTRRMTLEAPASGYVVEKNVLEGQFVEPGMNLYRIADLSRVWILAEVYESEVSRLKPGHPAEIDVSYIPGESFPGRVDYVYPYLDPVSRTIRVRIVVPNPGLKLRPEMYTNVHIRIPDDRPQLVVPNEAILDTGERQIVFVSLGDGVLEPRELKVGLRTRDYTVILAGVAEGEPVVTSGNFLIDSESRLKAALAGMSAGRAAGDQP